MGLTFVEVDLSVSAVGFISVLLSVEGFVDGIVTYNDDRDVGVEGCVPIPNFFIVWKTITPLHYKMGEQISNSSRKVVDNDPFVVLGVEPIPPFAAVFEVYLILVDV